MKKPLKFAAWSGVISLILSLITVGIIVSSGGAPVSPIISVIGWILSIFFLYGFLVLGNKFKDTLLVVMAWIGIAFMVLFLIVSLFTGANSTIPNVSAQGLEGQENLIGIGNTVIGILLVLWILVSVFFGAYSILFGIGLLKIGDKVKHARTSGILEIVSGATYIILIGLLIRLVANIFEIILLFKASEKFEN